MKITIKQARVGAGLTQAALAEAVGVSVVTYANKEKHPERFTARELIAICKATSIELQDIKGLTNGRADK